MSVPSAGGGVAWRGVAWHRDGPRRIAGHEPAVRGRQGRASWKFVVRTPPLADGPRVGGEADDHPGQGRETPCPEVRFRRGRTRLVVLTDAVSDRHRRPRLDEVEPPTRA